jgi:hypothetical protein
MTMGYRARWYADEDNLRHIGREHLEQLLKHYAGELKKAEIHTPPADVGDDAYYRLLANIFMRPEGIPDKLHDALFFIKALDTTAGENRIIQNVKSRRLKIELKAENSTADKVLQAWLQDEELVRRLYVEVGIDASKSFVHFRPETLPLPPMLSFVNVREKFEKHLATVFRDRARSDQVEVMEYRRKHELVYAVRHAEPFRRDTKQKPAGTEPLYYWPSVQDLIIYNTQTHHLRMNVPLRWQRKAYAREFSLCFFDELDLFIECKVFTLQPLFDKGRDALEAKMYGIEDIRLCELQQIVDEEQDNIRIRKAKDVFKAYEDENGGLPQEPIRKAVFGVLMQKGSTYQRKVTVEEGNVAKYTQDAAGKHVTAWLDGQGFTVGEPLTEEDMGDDDGTLD